MSARAHNRAIRPLFGQNLPKLSGVYYFGNPDDYGGGGDCVTGAVLQNTFGRV